MNDIILSIIVPLYNRERYIRRCIDSLVQQNCSYKYEVIIVDDCSNDTSGIICDKYNKPYIKVIHLEKNCGPVYARKVGIKNSQGKYITFVDSDDWVDINLYNNIINKFMLNPSLEIVCFGLTYFDENGKVYKEKIEINYGYFNRKQILSYVIPNMFCDNNSFRQNLSPSLCTKIFIKEKIESIFYDIPNNISIGEDALISYLYIYECNNMMIINNYGYYCYIHSLSMTHIFDDLYYKKIDIFYNYVKDSKLIKSSGMYKKYIYYTGYLYYRELRRDIKLRKIKRLLEAVRHMGWREFINSYSLFYSKINFKNKLVLFMFKFINLFINNK